MIHGDDEEAEMASCGSGSLGMVYNSAFERQLYDFVIYSLVEL